MVVYNRAYETASVTPLTFEAPSLTRSIRRSHGNRSTSTASLMTPRHKSSSTQEVDSAGFVEPSSVLSQDPRRIKLLSVHTKIPGVRQGDKRSHARKAEDSTKFMIKILGGTVKYWYWSTDNPTHGPPTKLGFEGGDGTELIDQVNSVKMAVCLANNVGKRETKTESGEGEKRKRREGEKKEQIRHGRFQMGSEHEQSAVVAHDHKA
ncbi:unnamed protein product [Tuber aestivum]|uniref:Uncharacterized protein n=1 Tax=Tuber aestivum TaxID=59557 RepID=A0A292Q957_9PEZI|nr:unnamed protein product [Tuber aestivum]